MALVIFNIKHLNDRRIDNLLDKFLSFDILVKRGYVKF